MNADLADEEAQASIRIAESVREFVQKRLKDAGFPTE